MKFTKINSAILFCASLIVSTLGSYAQNNKKVLEVSVFSTYQTMALNSSATAKTKKIAKVQFPGWSITCDKLNGAVNDIYGTAIALKGTDLLEKSQSCFESKLYRLGFNKTEWVKVSNIESPKAAYVNYKQVVNGHEVVFAKMGFRFAKDGGLLRIQAKNYGSPNSKIAPKINAVDAKKIAINDLSDCTITNAQINENWFWFPIPNTKGYELHPAWQFKIVGTMQGSVPLKLTGYVDAITGKIIYRTNEVKETAYDVTVKGVVYKNGMLNPPTLEALPELQIANGADTIYTDTTGYARDTLLALPQTSLIPLQGKWSTVIDSSTGLNPAFFDTITTAGTVFTYPVSAPSSERHVNAFYHVNRVHNFMKRYFPAFTGMDFSLPTFVDEIGGTCNAFYNGTSINFYAAGSGCNSFATFGDVIYHEYGHGISDHFYTNITSATIVNGSLNEALSDIWALSITHSAVLAANAFTGYGGFIRRYDMTPQVYPIDLNTTFFADVHQNGQIIAGTWWDVGINLGSVDSMTKLFTDVYYDVPDGPTGTEGAIYQTILIDALMADDNDGNLFNGTPHYAQIVAAFARHGIYMEGDATLTHSELKNQHYNVPITVSANLSISRPEYFHDLSLNYRINDTGTWQSIVMTNAGFNFTAIIPAQTYGTVVAYYFTVHDSLHIENAYFPITCNPNNPPYQSSIPYQFGVGIGAMDSAHFETATIGWGIGSNPGDDATAGAWQDVVPSPNIFLTSWPGGDHTTGIGKCLVTGSGTSGFLGQGVANGTSTIISPLFDISGFHYPVVSYYRWFSNDQGSNFKNDPWVVMIQDNGTGAWHTIERTYQSDVNWRRRMFQLHSYLPTSNKFRIKFQASDSVLSNWANNGQSTTVGGLDDFFIYDMDTLTAGVKETQLPLAAVYPNPANNIIDIVLTPTIYNGTISLFNMAGNQVTSIATEPNKNNYTLLLKELSAGEYLLVIQTDKMIQTKKIVIMHN